MQLRKPKARVHHNKKVGENYSYTDSSSLLQFPGEITITQTSAHTACAQYTMYDPHEIKLDQDELDRLGPCRDVVVEGVDIQKGVWLEMQPLQFDVVLGEQWNEYLVVARCGSMQQVVLRKNGRGKKCEITRFLMEQRRVRLARGRYEHAAQWHLEVFSHTK